MKIKVRYKFISDNPPDKSCAAVVVLDDPRDYAEREPPSYYAYSHDWKSARAAVIQLVRIYLEKPKDEEIEITGE